MAVSIKLHPIKSGWSILQVIIFFKKYSFSLKINFVLVNSADPNEMRHYAAFHLGLYCLPKYQFFLGFTVLKGLDIAFTHKGSAINTKDLTSWTSQSLVPMASLVNPNTRLTPLTILHLSIAL